MLPRQAGEQCWALLRFVLMGIKTKPTSYKFVFFYMTLFLLVLLLYFSIEESLAFRPLQCLDFPLCCAHVFSHLSALPWQNSRQNRGSAWRVLIPESKENTSGCTGTPSQQQTSRPCLARISALPKTYKTQQYFSTLCSCITTDIGIVKYHRGMSIYLAVNTYRDSTSNNWGFAPSLHNGSAWSHRHDQTIILM